MIRKRTILALCPYVFSSLLTFAQTASQRPHRIGLLSDTTYFSEHATALQWDAGEQLAGLRQGMKDLGVVEGKDWILIPRIANRDHALLNKYAAELVATKVDVIVASSTTAAIAAHEATRSIPIVAWAATLGDTVPTRNGSNITGFKGSDEVDEHLKQLQMVVPGLKRVAVLYDTSYVVVPALLEKAKIAAKAAALELILVEVKDDESLAPAFDRMANENAQALLVLNHPRFHLHPQDAPTLALKYRLPMVSPYRESAEAGGLIAHHPDWQATWRRGARVIKQILDGTPPAEIPVQTGVMRNYINLKTANALGLKIPESLRAKSELIGADFDQITAMVPPQNTAADEAAIRAIVAENTEAFNRQDPAGTVAHRTEDFDHINVAGVWATSKAQLEKGMIDYFQTHHPTMTTSVEKIRFLTTDVAYAIVKRQYKDEKGTREAISTSVFQKINGKWWDAAFQNTFIQLPAQRIASTLQEPASVEQEIKQLEEERRQAVLHQDVEKLKRFYADGMTIVDIDGDFHVNANNTSATLNQPATRTTLKWIIDEMAVKPYGTSAAIVAMRVEIEDVLKGIHRKFVHRLMHVWVKNNGQWQIVARHGTEIAAAPITSAAIQHPYSDLPHETEIQTTATLTAEQQEIFDFHRKLHDAHWRSDVATLKQLLTADWFVTNPSGQVVTREQFLNSVKPGDPPQRQDEIRIRVFGEVAVMTLRTTWSDGRVQRGTEVFVRENGAWKQAANQQTLVRATASAATVPKPNTLPESKFITLNGLRLHYLEWPKPNAPTMLLIPGLGGGGGSVWGQFVPFASAMSGRFRIVALEPRGFGDSEWAKQYSWELVVADIDAAIDALKLAPATLLGHSSGATFALLYASRHPEKVAAAIAVEPGAHERGTIQPLRTFSSQDDFLQLARTRWKTDPSVDAAVRQWIEHGTRPTGPTQWEWRNDPEVRYRGLPFLDEYLAQLPLVTSRVLYVRGADSHLPDQGTAEREVNLMKNARLAVVPNAGHVVHLANPQEFLIVVRDFLAGSTTSSVGQLDPVQLTPEDYSVLLDNDRVRVLDWHMPPGVHEPMHSHPDNVVYTFDEYKLRLTMKDGKATELTSKPGTAFLMRATMRSPENIGTTQAHALQVELKEPAHRQRARSGDDAAPVASAQQSLPPSQTVTENLIRNDRVHVSRITHAPGQHVRMHYAPPMAIVFLSDAHFAWLWPDGKREEVSYKAGDAAWFPGGLHASQSLDDHDQRMMLVVPVDDPDPARAQGDPFIGTFAPAETATARPGAQSITFTRDRDWQSGTLRVLTNNGEARTFAYRAKFDDKEYPYTEPANLTNTVSLRRIDRRAFAMTERHDGQVVAVYTRVLSADGKVLTNCRWQIDGQGNETTHIETLQRESK